MPGMILFPHVDLHGAAACDNKRGAACDDKRNSLTRLVWLNFLRTPVLRQTTVYPGYIQHTENCGHEVLFVWAVACVRKYFHNISIDTHRLPVSCLCLYLSCTYDLDINFQHSRCLPAWLCGKTVNLCFQDKRGALQLELEGHLQQ